MQCENGYIKPGVRGILCRKAESPADGDLKGIAHALCGHQRFCPNQNCYTMLPGWENCTKLREKPVEAAESETAPEAGKPKGKKKTAKKSAESAERKGE